MRQFKDQNGFWTSLSQLILTAAACTIPTLQAAQVSLAWDPNTEPDVAGYKLYYSTPTDPSPTVSDVGNSTNAVVLDLTPGETYSFYVTCYNASGLESDASNLVTYTVPTEGPAGPQVSNLAMSPQGMEMQWPAVPGTTYRILYKNDFTESAWQVMDEISAVGESMYWVDLTAGTVPHRFYRIEVVP